MGAAAAHIEIGDGGMTDEAAAAGLRVDGVGGAWSRTRSPLAECGRADGCRLRTPGGRSGDRCGGRWQPGSGAGAQHHRGSKGRGVGDRWTPGPGCGGGGGRVRPSGSGVSHSQPLRCGGGYREWRPGHWAAAAIAAWVRVVRYVACDTLGGWAARSWPMGLCPLLPAVCAWRLCGRSRWAESVVLIRSGKREFPAGIIPDENGNRKYGRENIPTEFVPIPVRFPLFLPFSYFSSENGGRFRQ